MNVQKKLLDEVLSIESSIILSDLLANTHLGKLAQTAAQHQRTQALEYIKGILQTCYNLGQLRALIVSDHPAEGHDGEIILVGFGLVFNNPFPPLPNQVQRIYVNEPYRGRGVARGIVKAIKSSGSNVFLVAAPDIVPFCEKIGFHYGHPLKLDSHERFQMTKHLHEGYAVMFGESDPNQNLPAPTFRFNDRDILAIQACLESMYSQTIN